MLNFTGIKNILWDFDGVILDSMPVRDYGFIEVLKGFPQDKVDMLMEYHRANGGLSRYVKFRYFFEKILGETISDEEVGELAEKFSNIMRNELTRKENLIQDSLSFIVENHSKYNMHIVSGSDQAELRFLCKELGIDHYFLSIHGSPTPKNDLVENLLRECGYVKPATVLIGDSINDKTAADVNGISFFAYNNISLKASYPELYIENF